MPVGFNSPARNLFLLGSTGSQVVGNFFKTIDKSAGTDGVYAPDEIAYNVIDQKYFLAGTAADSNSRTFGWFEKRDEAGTADFDYTLQSSLATENTTLRAMELDVNNNLVVAGIAGSVPWIAKSDNNGAIQWFATTNTADVRYLGLASDKNGNYYACGRTSLTASDTQAFVEKFDGSGNPGWGKQGYMLGRDVVLKSIDVNDRGEAVAVGYLEDDSNYKGYIIKINANTGDVMWDRTLSTDDTILCTDCYIDSKDQIYVTVTGATDSYLVKYTPEGNMQWQRKTAQTGASISYKQVSSDGETGQTITFGTYDDGNDVVGLLSKYSRNGDLVFRRKLQSSFNNSDTFSSLSLYSDPSFYYLLYVDSPVSGLNGTPDKYTYGKVSSSGNGLGAFQYTEGTGVTLDYEIIPAPDEIGRLSDGSVRNDISDLITYPFSANNILFDDLSTQVTNKKRQMDGPGSFQYSGSPAIRVADFQEVNLLGDAGIVAATGTNYTSQISGTQFNASNPKEHAFDGNLNNWTTALNGTSLTWTPSGGLAVSSSLRLYAAREAATDNITVTFTDTSTFNSFTADNTFKWYDITGAAGKTIDNINWTHNNTFSRIAAIEVDGVILVDPRGAWEDQSGNGNDGVVNGPTHNAAGYFEFDGTDNEIISGPKCNTLFGDGGSGTIEMWVRPNDVTTRQTLCSGYITGGSTQPDRWDFEISAGSIRGGSHDNGYLTGTTTLSVNTWYHIVFTLDKSSGAGTLKAYINAVEDQTQTFSLDRDWATDVEFGIGNRYLQQTDFPLDADVGVVRTYRRALTAAAVQQNFNASQYKFTNVRPNTTPFFTSNPILINNNLLLNYDFGSGACIQKSSNVAPGSQEIILDDAGDNGAAFGDQECVAVGYGKVVVGARGEDNGVYTNGGKAYVYNATTGALEVTLTPSNIAGNDMFFGNAVDIDDVTGRIAVTTPSSIYLYDADGSNEVIIDSNTTLPISPPGGLSFGTSVAISSNRVWTADDNVPTGPLYNGTVYCFDAETGAFIYQLRPKYELDNFYNYGHFLAAGEGKLAVGSGSITHSVTGRAVTGKVYLYDVDGSNEKVIEPLNLTTSSGFGELSDLDIGYGMIVIGAARQQRTEDPQAIGSGEVFVFDTEGNFKFSMRPSDDPADEDADGMGFGGSVAISSDRIAVGARYYVGNPGGVAGRAYLFDHSGKELQAWIPPTSPIGNASDFGSAMDAAGGTLAIGAAGGSPDFSGRVYIYPVTGTPSGKILNLSGTTYNGTNYNGTVNGPVFNPAGYFEFGQSTTSGIAGSFDYNDGSNQDFTVEAWIYGNNWNVNGNTYNAILNRSDGTNHIFSTYINSSGEMASWFYSTGGAIQNSTSSSSGDTALILQTGVWNHCVWIHNDGAGMEYYLNNSAASTYSNTNTRRKDNSNQTFTIGRWNQNQYELDGRIGQLRFYDRKLFAAEISQNFNATRARYGV